MFLEDSNSPWLLLHCLRRFHIFDILPYLDQCFQPVMDHAPPQSLKDFDDPHPLFNHPHPRDIIVNQALKKYNINIVPHLPPLPLKLPPFCAQCRSSFWYLFKINSACQWLYQALRVTHHGWQCYFN